MTIIERSECPEHGSSVGIVGIDDRAWCSECQAYIVTTRVKYVPASQLAGAVDERDDLLIAVRAAISYLDDPTCENRLQLARLALDHAREVSA